MTRSAGNRASQDIISAEVMVLHAYVEATYCAESDCQGLRGFFNRPTRQHMHSALSAGSDSNVVYDE